MFNYIRALLSPDIRQARRLLRLHTGTSQEAFHSAEKILAMASYCRHPELSWMRAGCLIEGMAKSDEGAVKCAKSDLSCLVDAELVDFGAEALRSAARDANDVALRSEILSCIPNLPNIFKFRVVGELYDTSKAKTAQKSQLETSMHIYATSLQAALPPAYSQYKKQLVEAGYTVDGKTVNGGFLELCLMAFWA